MMHRTLTTLFALLAAAVLAAPAAFGGNTEDTISLYCKDHGDLGLSHGACVAQLTNGNITPHNADVCKMQWVQDWVDADNHGQCVKALNDMKL